jgi:hypothetical protein
LGFETKSHFIYFDQRADCQATLVDKVTI